MSFSFFLTCHCHTATHPAVCFLSCRLASPALHVVVGLLPCRLPHLLSCALAVPRPWCAARLWGCALRPPLVRALTLCSAPSVGPAASAESYLDIDRIMGAIKETGAEAVHPGYGFLSENKLFARALLSEGVEFIGPSELAIDAMGDKIKSMRIAEAAGVSCAPRFDGEVATAEEAVEIARDIGYPIIMKASAGGGGKGMRVAWDESEMADGFMLARNEAKASFGDDRMMIQHYVCPTDGRHIEIQLVGDKHGNVLTLPERECSIQRRNQKVVEESPSVLLNPDTRKAMQEQAAELARTVDYSSAGTVEFLCDNEQNFYFLEMNTRLQVEHPVTELITGVDLVEQMIRVAAGHPLPAELLDTDWSQPSSFNGWAIESRVYAEDPLRGFLPSTGRLTSYIEPSPETLAGVRVDSGICEGSEISMFYDPMISKLCTHGATREEATLRMTRALDSYVIRGLQHNCEFLQDIYRHPRFAEGSLTTNFIDDEYADGFTGVRLAENEVRHLLATAVAVHARYVRRAGTVSGQVCGTASAAATAAKQHPAHLVLGVAGRTFDVTVPLGDDALGEVVIAERGVEGDARVQLESLDWVTDAPLLSTKVDGESAVVQFDGESDEGYVLTCGGAKLDVSVRTADQEALAVHMIAKPEVDTSRLILSPMPGALVSVAVEVGDVVQPGQEICVVEAMKMQNILSSPREATVKEVKAVAGDVLQVDQVIVEFE